MNERVKQELEAIAEDNGGILKAAAVVEFAKDESTALHSQFEWDDTEAAHRYRLFQARNVIRVHVNVIERDKEEHTYRVFVSMKEDRYQKDGGYRFMADVMSDEERRRKLLAQAREDFNIWKRKYQSLKELMPVFEAMDKVEEPAELAIAA